MTEMRNVLIKLLSANTHSGTYFKIVTNVGTVIIIFFTDANLYILVKSSEDEIQM